MGLESGGRRVAELLESGLYAVFFFSGLLLAVPVLLMLVAWEKISDRVKESHGAPVMDRVITAILRAGRWVVLGPILAPLLVAFWLGFTLIKLLSALFGQTRREFEDLFIGSTMGIFHMLALLLGVAFIASVYLVLHLLAPDRAEVGIALLVALGGAVAWSVTSALRALLKRAKVAILEALSRGPMTREELKAVVRGHSRAYRFFAHVYIEAIDDLLKERQIALTGSGAYMFVRQGRDTGGHDTTA